MVLRNWAVEHNVAAFSELSLAVHWQGRLSRGYSTMSVSNVKLLATAVVLGNLTEKVNECPLKLGTLCIICVRLGVQKVSVIRSSGVSAIQGVLTY